MATASPLKWSLNCLTGYLPANFTTRWRWTDPAQNKKFFDTDGSQPTPTPTPTPASNPLRKPRRARLTRDERLRIRTVRDVGWSYQAIVNKYGFTHPAVQYACTHGETPSKHTGRPPTLSEESGRGPGGLRGRFEEQPTADVRSGPGRLGLRLWRRCH